MKIPFHKPHITQKELDSVSETIQSGWLTMGAKTLEFEKKFFDKVQGISFPDNWESLSEEEKSNPTKRKPFCDRYNTCECWRNG